MPEKTLSPTPEPPAAPAREDHARTDAGHHPPTATQADQLASTAHAWHLALPPALDLGDAVVGHRVAESRPIYALDTGAQGPRCRAKLTGDPAIQLVGAPTYLPSASQPYDEQHHLRFEFHPREKGVVTNTLELVIEDAPIERFEVPVVASAHLTGEPTLAEQAAAARSRAQHEAVQHEDDARVTRVHQAIEDEAERDTHYHAGHLRQLDNARTAAQIALGALYQHRLAGIDLAASTVAGFVRRSAPADASWLAQLAWLAVDAATAGIAGGIAATAGALLKQATSNKTLIAVMTAAVKDTAKHGGTALKNGLKGPAESRARAGSIGNDARLEFFRIQRDQLVDETAVQALEVATTVHDELLPILQTDPTLAVSQMRAVAATFGAHATTASTLHMEQGIERWVQYVASVNGADHADAPFDEDHPRSRVDGLIDIAIKVDPFHPEAPVAPTSVTLTGVTRAAVNAIGQTPLLDLGLAVRASGDFDSPTSTLTVLRRADGTVSYAHTEGGEERGWLEAKARMNGRGPDALWGARIVLENELMTNSLATLPTSGVYNDDAS